MQVDREDQCDVVPVLCPIVEGTRDLVHRDAPGLTPVSGHQDDPPPGCIHLLEALVDDGTERAFGPGRRNDRQRQTDAFRGCGCRRGCHGCRGSGRNAASLHDRSAAGLSLGKRAGSYVRRPASTWPTGTPALAAASGCGCGRRCLLHQQVERTRGEHRPARAARPLQARSGCRPPCGRGVPGRDAGLPSVVDAPAILRCSRPRASARCRRRSRSRYYRRAPAERLKPRAVEDHRDARDGERRMPAPSLPGPPSSIAPVKVLPAAGHDTCVLHHGGPVRCTGTCRLDGRACARRGRDVREPGAGARSSSATSTLESSTIRRLGPPWAPRPRARRRPAGSCTTPPVPAGHRAAGPVPIFVLSRGDGRHLLDGAGAAQPRLPLPAGADSGGREPRAAARHRRASPLEEDGRRTSTACWHPALPERGHRPQRLRSLSRTAICSSLQPGEGLPLRFQGGERRARRRQRRGLRVAGARGACVRLHGGQQRRWPVRLPRSRPELPQIGVSLEHDSRGIVEAGISRGAAGLRRDCGPCGQFLRGSLRERIRRVVPGTRGPAPDGAGGGCRRSRGLPAYESWRGIAMQQEHELAALRQQVEAPAPRTVRRLGSWRHRAGVGRGPG